MTARRLFLRRASSAKHRRALKRCLSSCFHGAPVRARFKGNPSGCRQAGPLRNLRSSASARKKRRCCNVPSIPTRKTVCDPCKGLPVPVQDQLARIRRRYREARYRCRLSLHHVDVGHRKGIRSVRCRDSASVNRFTLFRNNLSSNLNASFSKGRDTQSVV